MSRPPRLFAAACAAALVLATAWLAPGCGTPPEFDKAVEYTPESLAQELALRTKSLAPSARKADKKRTSAPKGAAAPGYVAEPETKAQSKGQTKKAEVADLDDVLDDIEAKGRSIKALPAAEVFAKTADAVSKDQTLDAKDRDLLVEKLREMAKAGD
ncbi:hypothetical protein [Paludisphaera soli]|uniref:hypothetical protein n=1 Tax=Paludisphaera soli TaxID=2712865 RepID=UPI0013EC32F7|nr:hypothetical protein [Paludisphaera soli]